MLDKKGLDALVGQIRAKFESVPSRDEQRSPEYARRKWGGALKTLLAGQCDVEAYIALCEQTEFNAQDCLAIAKIYRNRRRPEDALTWVERGLAIASSDNRRSFGDYELYQMQRALLANIGRPGDARQSAWAEFEAHPSIFTYKELMRYVPDKEEKSWHQKAMQASEKGSLANQIELWLKKKEIDRLLSRLGKATCQELENLSHYTAELLAGKLERSHPDISARVYCALCMRIINAGKSSEINIFPCWIVVFSSWLKTLPREEIAAIFGMATGRSMLVAIVFYSEDRSSVEELDRKLDLHLTFE